VLCWLFFFGFFCCFFVVWLCGCVFVLFCCFVLCFRFFGCGLGLFWRLVCVCVFFCLFLVWFCVCGGVVVCCVCLLFWVGCGGW
ncbi:hypothetical protein, partial [Pseudomonas syringae group genomosp. 7]|uniref:hypothetical protein n=1 Tax=Pseudomonas syringae group genomosp. 7 TaxID=251699 RepID=UPI00376FAFC8